MTAKLTQAEWESLHGRPYHEWREAIAEEVDGLAIRLSKLQLVVESTIGMVGRPHPADKETACPPFHLGQALVACEDAQSALDDLLWHASKESICKVKASNKGDNRAKRILD